MNKARREKIAQAMDLLNDVRDEEQDAFDNLPDSFREGEQGQAMETCIEAIDEAIGYLEGIVA